MDIKIIRRN